VSARLPLPRRAEDCPTESGAPPHRRSARNSATSTGLSPGKPVSRPAPSPHAPEPDVGGGAVLRLRRPGGGPVAVTVLRRAQMRSALEHLADGGVRVDGPRLGVQHLLASPSRCRPAKIVVVHSHTLPIMSTSPKSLGGNAPTGEVPTQPSAPSLRCGKAPCQVLAINRPPGAASGPHGYVDDDPARAAYSHSASVGSRRPAHAA